MPTAETQHTPVCLPWVGWPVQSLGGWVPPYRACKQGRGLSKISFDEGRICTICVSASGCHHCQIPEAGKPSFVACSWWGACLEQLFVFLELSSLPNDFSVVCDCNKCFLAFVLTNVSF